MENPLSTSTWSLSKSTRPAPLAEDIVVPYLVQTHLNWGELVADPAVANAETPGSGAAEAVVEEVELGRDIGSMVAGSGAVPSSMTDLIGGNAGDAVRVGMGEVIGGRLLSACNDASVEDAVVGKISKVPSVLGTNNRGKDKNRGWVLIGASNGERHTLTANDLAV
ncbi:hypothetical protein F4774DRAFT_426686 [Daldinia eschscholtzii]|nr:hypothetical protein F4774DRAFT_426686 [Daldinia eschscholtzii]